MEDEEILLNVKAQTSAFFLMGVSGSGKSTIGKILSEKFALPFIDGDDLHPQSNVQKMLSSIPLNDADRLPWLEAVRQQVRKNMDEGEHTFVACSALKKKYRDFLRDMPDANVWFIYLKGNMKVLKARMDKRKEHIMKSNMLKSQFEALEEPNREEEGRIIVVNVDDRTVDETVNHITDTLNPIIGSARMQRFRVNVQRETIEAIRTLQYRTDTGEVVQLDGSKLDAEIEKATLYQDATIITRKVILEEQDTPVITVVNGDCLVEGLELKKKGFNPLVLNMASHTVPGGGYGHGAGAQEENLFRRTNLFRYHEPKRKEWYPLPPTGGIYCPNALVIRNSEQLAYCWLEEPETMSFVAVAAVRRPKLIRDRFGEPTLTDQNKALTRDKIKAILNIGLDNGHDAIVLSAFGCGAFCNPPATVAQLFWEVISSGYAGGVEKPKTYRQIVFAIFDDHNANRRHNDEGNLVPFQRRFAQGLNGPDRIIVQREEKEDQGHNKNNKKGGKNNRNSFFSRYRPSK